MILYPGCSFYFCCLIEEGPQPDLVETFDEHVLKLIISLVHSPAQAFRHACKLQALMKTHQRLMMTSNSDCSCWYLLTLEGPWQAVCSETFDE